jgi:uncharacterized membrane protein
MSPRLADERGFVIASLLRMVIILLVLGLIAVEGGSILFSSLSLQDSADVAAVNAADRLRVGRSVAGAQQEAALTLNERDSAAELIGFEVLADGSIRLRARKQATTLFVHRIGFLEDLAVVEATATAAPPSGQV